MKSLALFVFLMFNQINTVYSVECDPWLYSDMAEYAVYKISTCEKENTIYARHNSSYKRLDCINYTKNDLSKFNNVCTNAKLIKSNSIANYSYCKTMRMYKRAIGQSPPNVEEELLANGSDEKICGNYAIKMAEKLSIDAFENNTNVNQKRKDTN